MRVLPRLLATAAATAALVAGGLTVTGGTAQAAACSGSTGVTVVIDYGSNATSTCANDAASAMAVLKSVASVTSPPQYPGTVVCQINSVPSNNCSRGMPPASAYWAFYHANRGGSWQYSSVGVAEYNPAPGTAIGFAFGAGARPDIAPPPATAPKPSPKPSPSSSQPKPPAPPAPKGTASSPKPKASSTAGTSGAPRGSASSGSGAGSTPKVTVLPNGKTTTVAPKSSTSSTTSATTTSGTSTTTTDGATTQGSGDGGGQAMAPTSGDDGSGSNAPFWAGLGLVVLIGAAAAYLARRRRAQH